jgi:protein-disulfide isomerase
VTRKFACLSLLLFGLYQLPSNAQTPAPKTSPSTAAKSDESKDSKTDPLATRVEQYLRNLYAWGPEFGVKIGPTKASPIADLQEVTVTVSKAGQSDSAVIYVSKSGKYMVRGELNDMTADPFAEINSKLNVGSSPTLGPPDATITLVEFADFECPACRQLDLILRDLLPKHPEARLVFKHYPLTEIHPWAMTAAEASQCVYQQDHAAFWKFHDAVYDAQDVITPENAWDKLKDLAGKAGLNEDNFKACMATPEIANHVKSTIEEGHSVTITATPTTFVNGRRVVGPDATTLKQEIEFIHTTR